MGKNKKGVIEALKYTFDQGIKISAVITKDDKSSKYCLKTVAHDLKLLVLSEEELYNSIIKKDGIYYEFLKSVDVGISYLFWNKINEPLLNLPGMGFINFHPAPLPEYKGWGLYAFAIFNDINYWGVSAHYIDENIDTGDIIKVKRFPVEMKNQTALSLERMTQIKLFELYKKVIQNIKSGKPLQRKKQPEGGKYYSRKEFELLRKINSSDSLDDIEKKIRAFWFPPFQGAEIKINGKPFSLINEKILREIEFML